MVAPLLTLPYDILFLLAARRCGVGATREREREGDGDPVHLLARVWGRKGEEAYDDLTRGPQWLGVFESVWMPLY